MPFHRLRDVDLAEQVHIFGLLNIHSFGPKISLKRLFSLIFNYAKPQLMYYNKEHQEVVTSIHFVKIRIILI